MQEPLHVFRDKLDAQSSAKLIVAQVTQIFVEVGEHRRERKRFDAGRACPLSQGRNRNVAGGIAVAGDVKAP